MRYMLDTNICIYVIKNKPEKVLKKFKESYQDGLCISAITLAELEYGVEKSTMPERNALSLLRFLSIMQVLPFDNLAASYYGQICADLHVKGTPIGTMDMLIAAHARSLGLTLVSNNLREFDRVLDLSQENWAN